jgi:ferredoxin
VKNFNVSTIHERQYKKRSNGRRNFSLLGTIAWGILEGIILRIVGKIEKFWPHFHNRFMGLMHGWFGGVVTPFENNLEKDPKKRTWETRDKYQSVNAKGEFDETGMFVKRGEMVILPNEEILNLALRANLRTSVSYCFCRLYAKEQGKPCPMNAPIRTCLTLYFPQSVDVMATKPVREDLKKKERILYKLFKKCDEIGLVHQVIWLPSPNYTYVLCNCCPCCCEVLATRLEIKKERQLHQNIVKKLTARKQIAKEIDLIKDLENRISAHEASIKKPLTPIVARSMFIAKMIDPEECIHCGKCEERCYFDSRIMVHGKLHSLPENCYGCGLCVSTCPKQNIELIKRKKSVLMGENSPNKIKHTHPH